ncbi:MAG: chorismate mutase, partial [Bacteroidales bacterium]
DFIFRDPFSASSRLEQYRTVLDEIDEELLSVLSHRMELIRQMGCLKKDENLSVLQLQRWKQVLNRCMDLAKQKDLDPQFIKEVFSCVHAESVRIQNEIFGKSK